MGFKTKIISQNSKEKIHKKQLPLAKIDALKKQEATIDLPVAISLKKDNDCIPIAKENLNFCTQNTQKNLTESINNKPQKFKSEIEEDFDIDIVAMVKDIRAETDKKLKDFSHKEIIQYHIELEKQASKFAIAHGLKSIKPRRLN